MDASHRRGLARRTGPLDRPVVSCT
jgi:hypothetical protein